MDNDSCRILKILEHRSEGLLFAFYILLLAESAPDIFGVCAGECENGRPGRRSFRIDYVVYDYGAVGVALIFFGAGIVYIRVEGSRHKYRVILDTELFTALVQANISIEETHPVFFSGDSLEFAFGNFDILAEKFRIGRLGIDICNDVIGLHESRCCFNARYLSVLVCSDL